MQKNFVLDANILIHDPQSILNFADNRVIIPVGVIAEIDRFKKEVTDRGFNARRVVRLLDELRTRASLAAGVPLDSGGLLRVHCDPERLFETNGHADVEILRVARKIQQDDPATPVVIVTKDINLRIRADALGLRAEDYETDHVGPQDVPGQTAELALAPEEADHLRTHGWLERPGLDLPPNAYATLRPRDERATMLARMDPQAQRLVALLGAEHGLLGVRARNREQYFAMDAVLDERLQLVTLLGKAGTGKTLIAIAGAMQQTLRHKHYKGITICRPIVPVGRDLGYLPGDVEHKLDPWMKPILDTIEYLIGESGPIKGHHDAAGLLRSGIVEIQPLTYIRGRSIANRFVIIDEAQNLTPLEVKTVITRVGQGAKVALTGDPWQIDNPYVDANSNGFNYLANRFRGQPVAAHVELRKGERSPLAELAANLL